MCGGARWCLHLSASLKLPCRAPQATGLLLAAPLPLQAVLGVFQKLIASRAHDHEGFNILGTLVESLDYQAVMAQVGVGQGSRGEKAGRQSPCKQHAWCRGGGQTALQMRHPA